MKAAAVVQRLTEYAPAPRFHELWRQQVETLQLDDATTAMLLDPAQIDDGARRAPACRLGPRTCTRARTPRSPATCVEGADEDQRDPRA